MSPKPSKLLPCFAIWFALTPLWLLIGFDFGSRCYKPTDEAEPKSFVHRDQPWAVPDLKVIQKMEVPGAATVSQYFDGKYLVRLQVEGRSVEGDSKRWISVSPDEYRMCVVGGPAHLFPEPTVPSRRPELSKGLPTPCVSQEQADEVHRQYHRTAMKFGWKKGPMPENTWNWGAVCLVGHGVHGFKFADFKGDHAITYPGEEKVTRDQIAWYCNALTTAWQAGCHPLENLPPKATEP